MVPYDIEVLFQSVGDTTYDASEQYTFSIIALLDAR